MPTKILVCCFLSLVLICSQVQLWTGTNGAEAQQSPDFSVLKDWEFPKAHQATRLWSNTNLAANYTVPAPFNEVLRYYEDKLGVKVKAGLHEHPTDTPPEGLGTDSRTLHYYLLRKSDHSAFFMMRAERHVVTIQLSRATDEKVTHITLALIER